MTLDLTLGGLITLAWVLTTVACVVMGVLVVAAAVGIWRRQTPA